jgi:tRNA-uridine 2-sulfurtransferase
MKVVAAMSGGVDSSVAAALLSRQGHEVVGVTLQLADLSARGLGASRCCSPQDVGLAREAAERLGIPHYVLDMETPFRRAVLEPFIEAYRAGETPSPCIRCNSRIKFGELAAVARQFGAEALATGHYARASSEGRGRSVLRRAADRAKDQSYFLFELSHEQLAFVRFPLGELTKDEVRRIAREADLPNADRRESQEVCFVPEGSTYAEVLERLAPGSLPAGGEIVDGEGRVLGDHDGVHLFTVGQRKGLGVASRRRLYVLAIDAEQRRVVVGGEEETRRRSLRLRDVHWFAPPDGSPVRCAVQVRSRHTPARAEVRFEPQGAASVELDEPVASPAPGQAAVCYEGDRVLGGGWIVSAA